jgi:hypothetical protein
MRSAVRGKWTKPSITIAIFHGGNPHQNDRMKLITRSRTGAKKPSIPVLQVDHVCSNDSALLRGPQI